MEEATDRVFNRDIISVKTHRLFEIDDIVRLIDGFIPNNKLSDCNRYLRRLKLKHYKLNKKYSLKYCRNIDFRNLIDSKIFNSRLQLSLNLSYCSKITDRDLSILGHVHALDLSNCYNITDVSLLGNIYNEESSIAASGEKTSLVYQDKDLKEELSHNLEIVSNYYKFNPDLANYNLKYGYTLSEAKKGFAQAGISITGLPESSTNKVLFSESGTLDSVLSNIASKYG